MTNKTNNSRGDMPTSARAAAVAASACSNTAADGPTAHRQRERQNRRRDNEADAGIGRPPADQRYRQAHQERPDRSGEIIAGRDDDDREPSPLDEPMRNIRHHRREAGSRANSDQHMGGREHGEVRRVAGENKADAQSDSRDDQGQDNAVAVSHPPERDRREGQRAHHHSVRKRSRRAVDAEVELRRRQDHDHRPHARPDQGRDQQRQGEPGEGVGAVGSVTVSRRRGRLENWFIAQICATWAAMANCGNVGTL